MFGRGEEPLVAVVFLFQFWFTIEFVIFQHLCEAN